MFKTIGNLYQGVNSIVEASRKKKDGKKFIAQAQQRQRNFERNDLVNNAAQIQVNGDASDRAIENMNLNAAQSFDQAADAGIRGVGMIGKIQQNLNSAAAQETDRLAKEQAQVNIMKAQEQSKIQDQTIDRENREEARTDQMLERGQALRSQGAAETGAGASQIGGAVDSGIAAATGFGKILNAGGTIGSALTAGAQGSGITPNNGGGTPWWSGPKPFSSLINR